MPVTQGSSSPFATLGRSIFANRRDQSSSSSSMDDAAGSSRSDSASYEVDLESFQRLVAGLFHDLGSSGGDELLSLAWIRKVLEVFLKCQEEFRLILSRSGYKFLLSRPPVDRMVSEFFERTVKALDVCNAIRDGIDLVRNWGKHLEIVRVALDFNQRTIGEGQFRRAKKALTDLTIAMLDEKESSSSSSVVGQRNRSFGRNNKDKDAKSSSGKHLRSLSWSVSRSWSAAKQLQAIANNLTAPRNNEMIATNGFAVPIFTMNSVLLFVMWVLVAAIPCQDRGFQQTHFAIPRGFVWAAPLMALHEKIMDESKKRDRKNSNGLLREIHQIEKCTRHLSGMVDSVQFPLSAEKELEVREEMEGLVLVCNAMRQGLDPLETQVREVFHRIVRSRTEGLDNLGYNHHA